MNSRAAAAEVIATVIAENKSLTDCLPEVASRFTDPRDKAFLQAICYGVCRWFFKLDEITAALLDKPLKYKDNDIFALILVGLYQLMEMRVPEHAAVAETVDATKHLDKEWAKGLVNAVLRNYLRHKDELVNELSQEGEFSHPAWFIQRVQDAYPNDWQQILEANNQHPPFSLRINEQRISSDDYLRKLDAQEIKAERIPETRSGIILEAPLDVRLIPGFLAGEVSVQDGAAQLAAQLLMLEPGLRVLDACAAPGGKTAHMLELQPDIDCTAIDRDPYRVELIKENLARLHLSAKLVTADAANLDAWWDGELFDRVLLDAPCSASGVIRRHPEIKLLRDESDIDYLVKDQLRLMNALWKVLKKEGLLLYATCSIFPEENHKVIQRFIQDHPEAVIQDIAAPWGTKEAVGRQILPAMCNMDGFYYACLRK